MTTNQLINDYVKKYNSIGNIENHDTDLYECALLEEMDTLGIMNDVLIIIGEEL